MKNTFAFTATMALLLITFLTTNAQSIKEEALKTNISTIEKPVAKLQQLEPIYYSFNTAELAHLKLATSPQYGFKLESAKENFPYLIETNGKSYNAGKNNVKTATYQDINAESLIPLLVAAIQEQQQSIEALKKEIAILKEK